MQLESQRLDKEIKSLETKISKLPPGKLILKRNEKRDKWYCQNNGTLTHIPRKNRTLAEQLAAKKYLTQRCEEFLQERNAINNYLRHHKESKADEMLAVDSRYRELLGPFFKPLSEELTEWMNSPYDKNEKYAENLTQKVAGGGFVRSKSEAIIEIALRKHKIPFRYECALQVGDAIFYPDFTIRHPRTGKEYYWEHFGKMDDEKYARNTGGKLQMYIASGIVPGVELITSYETKDKPLSVETVENLIKEFFE